MIRSSPSVVAFGFASLAIVAGCAPAPSARDGNTRNNAPTNAPLTTSATSVAPAAPLAAAPELAPATTSTTSPSADPPVECRHGERRYGTTCCYTESGGDEGGGRTSCYGPNLGTPCTRKSDCDIFCSCDDPTRMPPQQGSSPRGPAAGTLGVTGQCGSSTARGAWVCRIDEHGRVTHRILD